MAGQGGQGGTIFNLGGDGGVDGGFAGLPGIKPDAGFGDAGFLLPDGGIDPNSLPPGCKCHLPGKPEGITVHWWLAAAVIGLAGVRRRRYRQAA
jgi:MYXO-CTERM domain-containing protein